MGLLLSFFYLSWCTKYYELQRHFVGVRGYGMRYCNANGGNTQRHLVQLRGYGMMYCNANGGKLQRHFMGVRGYGHDKSDPYGCWRSAILWLFTDMQIPKNCAYTYTCNSLWHNNIHRTPTFAMQKPYFCNVKTPFLHAKNHTFARQKGGFCFSL